MSRSIQLPLTKDTIKTLKQGESVLLSGNVYLARDAAHKRLCEMLERGETLPIDPVNAAVYYCGPTATPPGRVIGSAGPTTSSRMDAYTPAMLDAGITVMIGKGPRSGDVARAIHNAGAVYFAAIGGAGVYLASKIVSCETVAFPELGAEAVRLAEIVDFPVTVVNI